MQPMNRFLVTSCLLACGLAASMPADAALSTKASFVNPAGTCQLSVPTTDTEVRPKATGFRNESTSKGAFTICGYGKPSVDGGEGNIRSIIFGVASIDGVARTFNCTAVVGLYGYSSPPVYSTKTISTSATNALSVYVWTPGDFGGSGSYIPGSIEPSVTCTLPPQTAIVHTGVTYDFDIGS